MSSYVPWIVSCCCFCDFLTSRLSQKHSSSWAHGFGLGKTLHTVLWLKTFSVSSVITVLIEPGKNIACFIIKPFLVRSGNLNM